MRVAILQLPAPEVFVPDGAQDEAWAATLERVDDAARDEPDLVVLPEAAYPAWFLPDAAATPPERTDAEVLATLSERARRHHITLAAGVVLGRPDAPENAAVLFAPTGEEIARAGEALPAAWFRRGRGPVAVDLGGVAGALAAGADLLDPRWVEAMAEAGTRVVISTGAPRGWPRDGAVAGDVATAVIPSRAAEVGAWVVSAGRAGVEADATSYAGGAGVASPDGRWAVRAPADRPGIVLHTVDTSRPAAGPALVPDDAAARAEPAERGTTRIAALALDPSPSAVDLVEAIRASVRTATALGALLIVLPDLTGTDARAVTQAETLPLIEAVSAETHSTVVATLAERAGGILYRAVFVVEDGRTLATHRQTSLSAPDLAAGYTGGVTAPPVVTTAAAGRLGLLVGREAFSPAAAASLRRRGAQTIAWCAGAPPGAIEAVARARAWEQRIPFVAAGPAAGGAFIVEAGGHLLAASAEGAAMLVHASVERTAVR